MDIVVLVPSKMDLLRALSVDGGNFKRDSKAGKVMFVELIAQGNKDLKDDEYGQLLVCMSSGFSRGTRTVGGDEKGEGLANRRTDWRAARYELWRPRWRRRSLVGECHRSWRFQQQWPP